MSEITDEAYSEAMDEIERLQIQFKAALKIAFAVSNKNVELKKLIGELADALWRRIPDELSVYEGDDDKRDKDLLQRAIEVNL